MIKLLSYWFTGIRIYIALAAVLLTIETWWWASTAYQSSATATIQAGQTYGWLSISFLLTTLLVGPLMKLLPQVPGRGIIFDSRRALGLSAAWFGLIHSCLIYFKQFNAASLFNLPPSYERSALFGLVGLIILLLLAATSVNGLMKRWPTGWRRLQRLVYAAGGVLAIHTILAGQSPRISVIAVASGLILWGGILLTIAVRASSRKRLLLSLVIIFTAVSILIYGLARPAVAHELQQDNGVSAVLHIAPDDTPVSNTATTAYVSFAREDGTFVLANCACRISITGPAGESGSYRLQPVKGSQSGGKAVLTFKSSGLYNLTVSGQDFSVNYAQQVGQSEADATARNRQVRGYQILLLSVISIIGVGVVGGQMIARGIHYARRK